MKRFLALLLASMVVTLAAQFETEDNSLTPCNVCEQFVDHIIHDERVKNSITSDSQMKVWMDESCENCLNVKGGCDNGDKPWGEAEIQMCQSVAADMYTELMFAMIYRPSKLSTFCGVPHVDHHGDMDENEGSSRRNANGGNRGHGQNVDMLLLRSQDRMKRKEVDKEKEKEKETPGLRGVKKVELVEVFDGKTAESKTTKKMKYEDLEEVRRQEVFADMARIEREFEEIKDQMYAEKIQALQTECRSIMDGTHESFIARVGDLEKTKEQKAWLAQRWKEYQLMNIENVYLAECRQAEDEYNAEKRALRDKMTGEILEKQKHLEEEKHTISLHDGEEGRNVKRNLRRRAKEPASSYNADKPTTPRVNYTLTEEEIENDLDLIVKPLPFQGTRYAFPHHQTHLVDNNIREEALIH